MKVRTFGDLMHSETVLHLSCTCSTCKADRFNTPDYAGARKYSTRHYICDSCAAKRADEVLPRVRRAEAFRARMDAASFPEFEDRLKR